MITSDRLPKSKASENWWHKAMGLRLPPRWLWLPGCRMCNDPSVGCPPHPAGGLFSAPCM